MDVYTIQGGEKLNGSVKIEGSKNAVLPILAACIICGGRNVLYNCPDLRDVSVMLNILDFVGCKVEKVGDTLVVDTTKITTSEIPDKLVREMRSSVVILGAMLTRMKKTVLSYPGGCEIGTRPIDLHVKGLKELGAKISEVGGYLLCEAENLVGTEVNLDFPSVGATENIMLAAVGAEGTTIIRNAAREPEVVDLQNFLNSAGCRINGAGTNIIRIYGVKNFKPTEYKIMPDRIVAGTYLAMAAATYGNIEITDVIPEHFSALLFKLKEVGCKIKIGRNKIEIESPKKLLAIDTIKTLPYPAFPTDLQAPMMALITIASGTSIIIENIFENRFKHVNELLKMGAKITLEGRTAIVKGVNVLHGAKVEAKDLRGGAALILAGLAAKGETTIEGIHHVERGYEKIEQKLALLGANIKKSVKKDIKE
ncbi:MAG: UDP-N-acetylglucosamine 1-carboxyvinyltransferase [Ignavibacteriales bacterium]